MPGAVVTNEVILTPAELKARLAEPGWEVENYDASCINASLNASRITASLNPTQSFAVSGSPGGEKLYLMTLSSGSK
jgi:hypothetical protein